MAGAAAMAAMPAAGMNGIVPYGLGQVMGVKVRELAVNHRPRVAGVAKYGMWNRVFKAMRDLKTVRWMKKAYRLSAAREVGSNTASVGRDSQ